MQGCDAVLALRGKIKAGGWLRTAAKGFAVPIFSVKTSSPDHLTRAVQTILGLVPQGLAVLSHPQAVILKASKVCADCICETCCTF